MTAALLQGRRGAAEARAATAAGVYHAAAAARARPAASGGGGGGPQSPPSGSLSSPPRRQQQPQQHSLHHHHRLALTPTRGTGHSNGISSGYAPGSPLSPSSLSVRAFPASAPMSGSGGSPGSTNTAPVRFRGHGPAAGSKSPGSRAGGGRGSSSTQPLPGLSSPGGSSPGAKGSNSDGGGVSGFGRWPPAMPERAMPFLDDDLYLLLLQMLSEIKVGERARECEGEG